MPAFLLVDRVMLTSGRALREHFSPEEIRQYGTTHSTNKAFERYFQHELSGQEKIFKKAKGLLFSCHINGAAARHIEQ